MAWPSTFFAVVVAGAVTLGIAFLAGPSTNSGEFDDVVGRYLARNKIDFATPQFGTPLPSPPASGYAALESTHRPEPGAPIATRSHEARARSTSPIDIAAIAVVAIAICHGVWVGVLRAAVSLAVLGAASFAVRVWSQPLANWLQNPTGPGIRYDIAPWLAGVLIGVSAFAVVYTYAHVMRQGARAIERRAVDRIGGAAVGVAEGILAAGVLLFVTRGVLGPAHELVASSRAWALVERSEQLAGIHRPISPDVAAGPLGQ